MSFDKDTRNALSKRVATCRRLLTEDVTDQLRGRFGMHPDGTILAIDRLDLAEDEKLGAEALRELLEHFAAGEAGRAEERRRRAYDRLVLEISFTALNRLAALRLCEERGLVVECVRQGTASAGFQMFERVSGGGLGTRYQTYRVFLECLFDELALDLGVLFDRTTSQSAVFPGERCLTDVLAELNKPELAHLWAADETIGWIYQYFNPPEERKAMRDASQAPRNSRELAVRNQFFTPRYVVEFLTDNTLGRIWYEMRKGETSLKNECRYLVRRPNEVFLAPGEKTPETTDEDADLSQEELLKQPVHIEHRPRKDPRDIRILDPACGSGHFLLYAFDLLERIYEEAWEDTDAPWCEATGRPLREEYGTLDDLRRAVPKLIVEHNLHGVDIDPRAVQIAALALWLRAQKAWKTLGLKATERPRIERSNIVTAEPMPGEEDMRREFTAGLTPRVLGQLVDVVFEKMTLAGEAGSLLKIEEEIKDAVAAAKAEYVAEQRRRRDEAGYFPGMAPPHEATLFDFTDLSEEEFWDHAEELILAALRAYAEQAENGRAVRRRLFADDTARGFAFIDVCRRRHDVVLMNPPFGAGCSPAKRTFQRDYPRTKNDLYAAFIERGHHLLHRHGMLGAITSRAGFFLSSFQKWREEILLKEGPPVVFADLGHGVMDAAMVEAAAYCLKKTRLKSGGVRTVFLRVLDAESKANALLEAIGAHVETGGQRRFDIDPSCFCVVPRSPFAYWISEQIRQFFQSHTSLRALGYSVNQGLITADDGRFLRLCWEVENAPGWSLLAKGSSARGYASAFTLAVRTNTAFSDLIESANKKYPYLKGGAAMMLHAIPDLYGRAGLGYTRRTTSRFRTIAVPASMCFSDKLPLISNSKGADRNQLLVLLAITSSKIFSYLLEVSLGAADTAARSYETGLVGGVPLPDLSSKAVVAAIGKLARSAWEHSRHRLSSIETSHVFTVPALRQVEGESIVDYTTAWSEQIESTRATLAEIQRQIDELCFELYGIDEDNRRAVEHGLIDAGIAGGDDETDDEDELAYEAINASPMVASLLSWLLGVAMGRFDVRLATGETATPRGGEPFEPLPTYSPGMLTCTNSLPLDAPPADYPVTFPQDGMLVDDPGFNGAQPHRDDIVRRIREVFDLLWKDKAHKIEQEACEILGVKELRDYFRRPASFFRDHLKRYSKSRRKAPIYWPLSTASGSYTIWLYYHRLTDQTLYAAVNKYIEPKIAEVERAIGRIEKKMEAASGREATRLRDQLNEGRTLAGELRDLRQEMLRIAALPYRPNLNDGVIINAAPFHKLFGLRSWATETQKVWKKLEKGDYDWAHLAYTLWPDRVKEVCRKDRSIAIAHGLEELCEVEPPSPKGLGKKKGRKKKEIFYDEQN